MRSLVPFTVPSVIQGSLPWAESKPQRKARPRQTRTRGSHSWMGTWKGRVPGEVPSETQAPSREPWAAWKKSLPRREKSPWGFAEIHPLLRSRKSLVPAGVPSEIQSSLPWAGSKAEKKRLPWKGRKSPGSEDFPPSPGARSWRRKVPWAVPSENQSSLPVEGVVAEKTTPPARGVRYSGSDPEGPGMRSLTIRVPLSVPSVTQSSLSLLELLPWKKIFPPEKTGSFQGPMAKAFPVTFTVPEGVPSVFQR